MKAKLLLQTPIPIEWYSQVAGERKKRGNKVGDNETIEPTLEAPKPVAPKIMTMTIKKWRFESKICKITHSVFGSFLCHAY